MKKDSVQVLARDYRSENSRQSPQQAINNWTL